MQFVDFESHTAVIVNLVDGCAPTHGDRLYWNRDAQAATTLQAHSAGYANHPWIGTVVRLVNEHQVEMVPQKFASFYLDNGRVFQFSCYRKFETISLDKCGERSIEIEVDTIDGVVSLDYPHDMESGLYRLTRSDLIKLHEALGRLIKSDWLAAGKEASGD